VLAAVMAAAHQLAVRDAGTQIVPPMEFHEHE
jgi:hypothetical protein